MLYMTCGSLPTKIQQAAVAAKVDFAEVVCSMWSAVAISIAAHDPDLSHDPRLAWEGP